MRIRLLTPFLAVLSSSVSLAQPVATRPVEEIQVPAPVVPVLVPCDEPSAPCPARLPAPQLLAYPPARIPWQLQVSLSVTTGVVQAGMIFSPDFNAAATLGGDLRLLWSKPGKRWGLGLRLSGNKSLALKDKRGDGGDASGAELGFLVDVYGFWVSTGWGFVHYGDDHDGIVLPEAFVALGYDIPLGRHLALRLSTSASTLLVTGRLQAGGGLVVRF